MINAQKLIASAMTAFLTMATAQAATPSAADDPSANTEKCYGLVKAGQNDCATGSSSCAGSSTQDKQADAYVLMPRGLCEKLVGGKLTAN